jgi:hypothetical protein
MRAGADRPPPPRPPGQVRDQLIGTAFRALLHGECGDQLAVVNHQFGRVQ